MNLKTKIGLLLLAGSCSIIILSAAIGFFYFDRVVKEITYRNLDSLRDSKAVQIRQYFMNTEKHIVSVSENQETIIALQKFKDSFGKTKTKYSEKKLKEFYSSFINSIPEGMNKPDINNIYPQNPTTAKMQSAYIAKNSFESGKKDLLTTIEDGSIYNKVHAIYHPYFKRLSDEFGYNDILLVDAITGNIIYSVKKEIDFATNLLTGPYKNTSLARLFKKVLGNSKKQHAEIVDFEFFTPSMKAPALFIASPIYLNNNKSGILVFKISIEKVNDIITGINNWKKEGLGKTGEVYLAGTDYRMRSDSRAMIENPEIYINKNNLPDTNQLIKKFNTTVLFQKVNNEIIDLAMKTNTGKKELMNYNGKRVLSSYSQIPLNGFNWVIISEIQKSEAEEYFYSLILKFGVMYIFVFLFITTLSFYFSRKILFPLSLIKNAIKSIGEGKLTTRVDYKGNDEIGMISDAFNIMAISLENTTYSKEYLDNIIFSMSDALFILSPKESGNYSGMFTITLVNDAACKMFGFSRDELIGENIANIFLRSEDGISIIQKTLERGNIISEERTLFAQSEKLVNVRLSSSVMKQKNKIMGIIMILHDVTELTEKNKQLELAGKVFENANEGIYITDKNATIISVNKSFTEITGYTAEEVIGHKSSILKSDRQDSEFYKNMWDSLLDTGKWSGEIWNRKKNGEAYPELLTISSIKDENGQNIQYIALFHEITDMKKTEEMIKYQAYHDPLTSLPNKLLFIDRLDKAIQSANMTTDILSIMFIDFDNFKHINDSLGHVTGDNLLVEISNRLSSLIREEDSVARWGGDEFSILLNSKSPAEILNVVTRILSAFSQPLEVEGSMLNITPSIGISVFPTDGQNSKILLQNADLAMYKAKEEGKNTYHFYTEELDEQLHNRVQIENELKIALHKEQFILFYQPKVEIATGRMMGMEALVRWDHPVRGITSPYYFLNIAEETGVIIELGKYIMEEACRQVKAWQKMGLPEVKVSVNVSAKQLKQKNFHTILENILAKTKLDPKFLELEITESGIMENLEESVKLMHSLKEQGISLALDDFGTGYSSLSYLKKFPIDTLKIDQSFVSGMLENERDQAITSTIIELAKNLNMEIVAEGVETVKHLEFLKKKNCEIIQGYLFSKPLSQSEFTTLLQKNTNLYDANVFTEMTDQFIEINTI